MPTVQLVTNIALIGGSFVLFAVIHTLTAGVRLRDRLAGVFGVRVVNGVYRLAYNGFSVISLAVPLALVILLPDAELYRVGPPMSFLMVAVQLVGVSGVMVALLQTDLLSFSGLRQVIALLSGGDQGEGGGKLQTGGLYRWMRHPLYVFSLLAIWPLPLMTANILTFNIAATLYFLLGSIVEEGRLERLFGEEYRQYKQRVGWLMPKRGGR